MAPSSVFLGVVLLSAFPGPSVGGHPMPKLADRKLCADEECSRKSWGLGALGAWIASLWGGCRHSLLFLPRPHLHGHGPSGLRGPRLPFPDHTPGPSRVCLLQAEGPRAALLGRQRESWENRGGKGRVAGVGVHPDFSPEGKI